MRKLFIFEMIAFALVIISCAGNSSPVDSQIKEINIESKEVESKVVVSKKDSIPELDSTVFKMDIHPDSIYVGQKISLYIDIPDVKRGHIYPICNQGTIQLVKDTITGYKYIYRPRKEGPAEIRVSAKKNGTVAFYGKKVLMVKAK